jgi:hypothetical protein
MSEDLTNQPVEASAAPSKADAARDAKADRALQQRRKLLKAAAIAAPLLITLRARSAYAHDHTSPGLGSTGINYGPGSYVSSGDDDIPPPTEDKKPWWWHH